MLEFEILKELESNAKIKYEDNPSGVIRNWMSNKNSFDFYNLLE